MASNPNVFATQAWPPSRGIWLNHPKTMIPDGGFANLTGFWYGANGVPERIPEFAKTEIVAADTPDHFKGIYRYVPTGGTARTIIGRTKSGSAGIYYYDAGWTKVRGGTVDDDISMCQMNDLLFFANFTDTDASLGSRLQVWDGTNWRSAAITRPSGSWADAETTGGYLTKLKYYGYKISFVDADGFESTASLGGWVQLTGSNNKINFTGIELGPAAEGIASRKIYRTEAKEDSFGIADEPHYLLATIADNTTTTYSDTTADGDLDHTAAAPIFNAGWDSSVSPKGVLASAGRIWAWTDDDVYWSGNPAAITADLVLNGASENFGLNEPYYWYGLHKRSPGYDGDPIQQCIWFGDSLYAIKKNSIWQLMANDLNSETWQFRKVAEVGIPSPGAAVVCANGIYMVSRSHGYPETYFFDGRTATPVGVQLFNTFTGDVHAFWYLGRLFASCGNGTFCLDPDIGSWTKITGHAYTYTFVYADTLYHLRKLAPTWLASGAYSCQVAGNVRTETMITSPDADTGYMVAGRPETLKRWGRVRVQASASTSTTMTVSVRTEQGTQVVDTIAVDDDCVMIDFYVPKGLCRSRWLQVLIDFNGTAWATIDGMTVYGRYLRDRKALGN